MSAARQFQKVCSKGAPMMLPPCQQANGALPAETAFLVLQRK